MSPPGQGEPAPEPAPAPAPPPAAAAAAANPEIAELRRSKDAEIAELRRALASPPSRTGSLPPPPAAAELPPAPEPEPPQPQRQPEVPRAVSEQLAELHRLRDQVRASSGDVCSGLPDQGCCN